MLAGSQPCSWRRPLAVVRGRQLNRGAVLAIVPRRVDALMPPAATEYSNVIRTVARRAHSLGGSDTDPVYSAVLATVLFPCTRGQGEGKTVCLDPNLGALLRLTGRQARGRGSVSEPSLPASSSNPPQPTWNLDNPVLRRWATVQARQVANSGMGCESHVGWHYAEQQVLVRDKGQTLFAPRLVFPPLTLPIVGRGDAAMESSPSTMGKMQISIAPFSRTHHVAASRPGFIGTGTRKCTRQNPVEVPVTDTPGLQPTNCHVDQSEGLLG